MNASGNGRPLAHEVLARTLRSLSLSKRAQRACDHLGVTTVAEFLARRRSEFLAVPQCGPRTWSELRTAVASVLGSQQIDEKPFANDSDDRLLVCLIDDARAQRAFMRLGLSTVGDFLATPRDDFLRIPGIGPRTWDLVWERVQSERPDTWTGLALLPDTLVRLPVERLFLSRGTSTRLVALGATTVADMLTMPRQTWEPDGDLGVQARDEIRESLEHLIRFGLAHADEEPAGDPIEFRNLQGRLLAPLHENDRELLCQLIGLGTTARNLPEIAVANDVDMRRLNDMADELRARLHARSPSVLRRLRDEFRAELRAFEGFSTGDRLAPGTLGHTLVKATGDALLPLRLVAFSFPREFHLHDDCLTSIEPRRYRRFVHRLRQLTAPDKLPVPLREIEGELHDIVDPVPRGLLTLLLGKSTGIAVRIDQSAGEVVAQSKSSVTARLQGILNEEGCPLSLEDLVFHYRDRFRHARKGRLLTELRRDGTFLEIGQEIWSLRSWHEDELKAASEPADQLALRICTAGGKHNVATVLRDGGASAREVFLVTDCLRRDARVRSLGRGDFCPAQSRSSQVLDELLEDFRRAMGEVPLQRFLINQSAGRRRLVSALLRENRLFLQPSPDRIDVLSNYPFNEERMARLLTLTKKHLDQNGGYSTLSAVAGEVNQCDLGGSWLTEHLLGDLLRRNGPFEMLPGRIVAERDLELGGWIQARAREALRGAGMALTVDELLVEEPELVEFSDSLNELLQMDPMVQSADGQHYQVV